MTTPTKAQLEKAKAHSLRVYRLALKAAERGDWERAEVLTKGLDCKFCLAFRSDCIGCVVRPICKRRQPHRNAVQVGHLRRTPANGIRHFRKTIEQLEALEF